MLNAVQYELSNDSMCIEEGDTVSIYDLDFEFRF